MKNDALGDRMKSYEDAYRLYLPRRMPVIIRIDGKSFHTYAKGLEKPWDDGLESCMYDAATLLCQNIQGAQFAYIQSDEISVLVHNYKRLVSDSWFGNNLQKIASVSASLATAGFNLNAGKIFPNKPPALFDSRVWILPESEVNNYFVWRQKDAVRNSISLLAQALYSHSELQHKNSSDKQEMCFQKGVNWNALPTYRKRGVCVVKQDSTWCLDLEIPTFSQDKNYVEKYLTTLE